MTQAIAKVRTEGPCVVEGKEKTTNIPASVLEVFLAEQERRCQCEGTCNAMLHTRTERRKNVRELFIRPLLRHYQLWYYSCSELKTTRAKNYRDRVSESSQQEPYGNKKRQAKSEGGVPTRHPQKRGTGKKQSSLKGKTEEGVPKKPKRGLIWRDQIRERRQRSRRLVKKRGVPILRTKRENIHSSRPKLWGKAKNKTLKGCGRPKGYKGRPCGE